MLPAQSLTWRSATSFYASDTVLIAPHGAPAVGRQPPIQLTNKKKEKASKRGDTNLIANRVKKLENLKMEREALSHDFPLI
jgi:hypothetical protein